MSIRLHKYLADCGVASRRKCEEMIAGGHISVNGVKVVEAGTSIDPLADSIMIDGRPVNIAGEKVYILMNKPRGVTTTTVDTEKRRTVIDILGSFDVPVYPVGRLDFDTEGVLLLTSDNELSNLLVDPTLDLWKVYEVKVQGVPHPSALAKLKQAFITDDERALPPKVRMSESTGVNSWLLIELTGGRYHPVRRACTSSGLPIIKLRRIVFAGLRCDGMSPGEWRYLRPKEIGKLWAVVKIAKAASDARKKRGKSGRTVAKKVRPRARRYDEREKRD
jgi:23S rRNA pseudouridine2605 synthase